LRLEIDLQSLGEFLQYGYIADNRTIYKGIFKLRPGHRLILIEGGEPKIEPYWSVLDALDRRPAGSDADIEAEVEALLIDSCRLRMIADVPVGVYLSGGIDSSLVTAILAKHHDQDIRTYTIGFSDDSFDESRWAKKVADHCGTVHTEYILDVNEALEIAKDWGSLFDEPFADASGIPTLLVSRLASEEVKVVLSADGGDELFSGYKVYASVLKRLEQLGRVPSWLGSLLSAGMSVLPPRLPERDQGGITLPRAMRGPGLRKIHRLNLMLRDPTAGRLKEIYSQYWQPDEINRLIGTYESPRVTADSYPGQPATQLSLLDFHDYLPEDILTKVDRTTMAVSIEGREPMLDHRLVECAFALPQHLRRGDLGSKHILKKILYRYVPREIVDRPKQGFSIPLDKWLKTDLQGLVHDYLGEDRIRKAGIMNPELVTQSINRFREGDTTLGSPIWALLTFEMWRERWG
jgi:asparagine synthase (glutamine-hydrolysing)